MNPSYKRQRIPAVESRRTAQRAGQTTGKADDPPPGSFGIRP
ncbi:MAG: hypothetical protein Q8O00_08320 [Holophaga sp.]|nr:hypothetical protein [Holophaga sp.]